MSLPFTPWSTNRSGRRFVARIGANENVFGPSPRVLADQAHRAQVIDMVAAALPQALQTAR